MASSRSVLLAMVICSMYSVCRGDLGTGASYVFGDSLVDAGNNNYLPSLSKADMRPNGIDFEASGGQPTGRFTNGKTIADIIGDLLGLPNYAPPFLAPNTTGSIILDGVNYASGGGGIMNGTGRIFINRLSMDIQIDYFNITRKQLDDMLGKTKAKQFVSKQAIFSVTVGSNDFLNNYLLPIVSLGTRVAVSPDSFVDDLITNLKGQLTRLYTLDARKYVVANVGPIGCIPYQKTINKIGSNECVSLPNQMAEQYNIKLRDLLAQLNNDLPGAKFCLANVYDLVMELITNYQDYGFNTSSVACCGTGGAYYGLIPCGPTTTMCDDRKAHVFWDPYHPSEAANLLLAKYIVDGDSKYISPINLRKLQSL